MWFMKLKIFYAGQKKSDIITGGERRTAEVLEYLVKGGVEIVFMQQKNYPAHSIKKNFLLTNLWYVLKLIKINKTKDNIIIIEDYSQRFYLFIFNFFVSLIQGAKVVCLANAFYFSYRKSQLKNLIDKMVSILFFCPIDLVVAGGGSVRKQLSEMRVANKKVRVIYPALRQEFANNFQENRFVRENSPIRLLFVGRVNPVKGLEYLLEAVRHLNYQNLTLTVIGDNFFLPGYTQNIKQKIKKLGIEDRVRLKGAIKEGGKLLEAYQDHDIFVLPSLWDTSPIAIIEAMCARLPIVATNVGGIPEWVEDGVNGLLVPSKNSRALADAILKLIQDPNLREKMGQDGYERSFRFRNRTWGDVGRNYYEVILELVNTNP